MIRSGAFWARPAGRIREYLHLVKARKSERFLIGNNRGGINGWVGRRAILGTATGIR